MVTNCILDLFENDKQGEATLLALRTMADIMKSRNYKIPRRVSVCLFFLLFIYVYFMFVYVYFI